MNIFKFFESLFKTDVVATKPVLRVLLAGYRSWARDTMSNIDAGLWHERRMVVNCVTTHEELLHELQHGEPYDLVYLIGWSWIIPTDLCESNLIVGVHPSDLPDYAGGSPIQYQVLDGLTKTKVSLGRISAKIDDWEVYFKTEISLEGNIAQIFDRLEHASTKLFWSLFATRVMTSNLRWSFLCSPMKIGSRGENKKRLKPEQSKLAKSRIAKMTARKLYDFIRCRTEPYPNAFIQDETGTLRFTDVEFDEVEK